MTEDELPRRTIQHHAQRARREMSIDEQLPEDSIDAATALETKMLRIVKRDVARIEERSRKSGLDTEDSRILKEHHKTIASIREARRREAQARGKDPDRKKGGEEKSRQHEAKSDTIADRVRAESERRGKAEPVATDGGEGEAQTNGSETTPRIEAPMADSSDPHSSTHAHKHDELSP